MQYAGINYNDMSGAPGISLSFFVQGCPHRCKGCHNPETWSFSGGHEFTLDTLESIIKGLTANGIQRTLCIMGGEPLCKENAFLVNLIITEVKRKLPDIKIYIWTGYTYEQLIKYPPHDKVINILKSADVLIDGPYIEARRDITLPMRGSNNQRVIDLTEKN